MVVRNPSNACADLRVQIHDADACDHGQQKDNVKDNGKIFFDSHRTIFPSHPIFNTVLSLLFLNLVADTPYDFQVTRFTRIDLDFLTDMADMYGNGVVCSDRLLIPDLLVDFVD